MVPVLVYVESGVLAVEELLGDGAHTVVDAISCVLPPIRSSSVKPGCVLSCAFDLLIASCACRCIFRMASYNQKVHEHEFKGKGRRLTRLLRAMIDACCNFSNISHTLSSSCSEADASDDVGARVTKRHITI